MPVSVLHGVSQKLSGEVDAKDDLKYESYRELVLSIIVQERCSLKIKEKISNLILFLISGISWSVFTTHSKQN